MRSICADAEHQTATTPLPTRSDSHPQPCTAPVPFGAHSTEGSAFSGTAGKSLILPSVSPFLRFQNRLLLQGSTSCASPELRKEDPVF